MSSSAFLFASVLLAPVLFGQTAVHTQHYENVLGTSLELKVRTATPATAQLAEKATLAEIDRENALLSAWQPTSEFSRWTRTHGTAVHVSPELLDVLSLFDAWRVQTHGALDASAETAVRVWKQAEAAHREPTEAELAAAVAAMQRPHWRIDRAAGTATHLDDAPIALNSFAKSYIADRAASAALKAGATGVLLNLGGDIVVRGNLSEKIAVANPRADAENDPPLDTIALANRTVATSGAYRRGVDIHGRHFSHIIDARTGQTAEEILSSTVVAPDASEAGALATAFSVMTPQESRTLAAKLRNVDYLLITATGERIASPHWSRLETAHLAPAAYVLPEQIVQHLDLLVTLELARVNDPRFRRPYIAVWVENQKHRSVKTLALWSQKPKYLPELKLWSFDAHIEPSALPATVTSATRAPGKYTLRWDGLDEEGKLVAPGVYTVCIEAAREHGSHQVMKQTIDFDGHTPQQISMPGNMEVMGAALDYGSHAQ